MLGKQGAGKVTQCVRLSHHYVIPHISTGDMLRAAVKLRTPLGLEAHRYMDAGELIPDEIVLKMVGERLDQDDIRSRGFVLDGFPRTVAQAKGLNSLLDPAQLDLAIDLEVPTDLVLSRLASRRICEDCGTIYSTGGRPRTNWTCDVCGGEVTQREDDTVEAIQRRLHLYEQQTAPLIAWYEEQDKLVKVSGVGDPDEVSDRVVEEIDERRQAGQFGPPIAHENPSDEQSHGAGIVGFSGGGPFGGGRSLQNGATLSATPLQLPGDGDADEEART
ncbi:MAG: adenylate kinase [Acidimicrobiales bacterium]